MAAADWILTTIQGDEAFESITVARLREIRELKPGTLTHHIEIMIKELEQRNAATVGDGYTDSEADERAGWLGCKRKPDPRD